MKESHKKILDIIKAGLVKLLNIVWIIVKSFFKAVTVDFYHNIKAYYKKYISKGVKVQEKPAEKSEETPKP